MTANKQERFRQGRNYWKYLLAKETLIAARRSAELILDWRGPQGDPQYHVYTTALHALYGRPFKLKTEYLRLEESLVPAELLNLHRLMINARDKMYAHWDPTGFLGATDGQASGVMFVVGSGGTLAKPYRAEFQPSLVAKVFPLIDGVQAEVEGRLEESKRTIENLIPKRPGVYSLNIANERRPLFKFEPG